jgi:uncharacterized protein YjbI with pentapeptide repeats
MANEDHVIQIKRGVNRWNTWRKQNPNVVPDLDGANFGHVDLREADLRNASLRSANFSGVKLRGADLRGAKLDGAELGSAKLNGVKLDGATLSGANFRGAKLSGHFSSVSFSNVNLRGTNLIGADFHDADLSGMDLCEANLDSANLFGANLSGANLRGANLREAKLGGANLREANLRKANLSGVNLHKADLSGMDFRKANLFGANLSGANLDRSNFDRAVLSNTDLRRSSLIDSRLDGASLTDAKLWETQRAGWSIKGITCQRAFWDREGEEATEYEDGAFERIFAEKPRIILRYADGMSPVDLAMLPLIVERLQVEHPKSSLHIRSVQDDGSGATVTITVEDLADRSDEAFKQDIEVMRGDLATIQRRLHQEERLRLQAEAGYRTMIEDVLPRLLDRTQPKTEVNVGQITGPTTIEGTTMSKDTYNIHGQAGAVGKNAHAHDMTFQQAWNQSNIDLTRLAEELTRLRAAMKHETQGTREQDKAIVAVADAEEAAIKGDGPTTLQHLKTASKWALGVAEKIGVTVATEAIKRAM